MLKLKDRRQRMLVKRMVELSLKDGIPDSERVSAVLSAVRNQTPRSHRTILRAYLAAIRSLTRESTLEVVHAGALDSQGIDSFRKGMETRMNRNLMLDSREDPSLIAGSRVTIGDHVWDASLRGLIARLID
ncbi:MAG: F0F1 ATP synthase subunit delta [Opitutales bacterium]|nr:F0F1 ATP synthase subunit delta [Opitutales bacterium]